MKSTSIKTGRENFSVMKSWQLSALTSATIPSTSAELLAKAILSVSMNVLRIKGHIQDLYGIFDF